MHPCPSAPHSAACPRALAKCRLCPTGWIVGTLADRNIGVGQRQATCCCCRRRFLEASSRPPATPFQGLASSFLTVSMPPSPNSKVNRAHIVRTSVLGEGRWGHCGLWHFLSSSRGKPGSKQVYLLNPAGDPKDSE
jgi:hypothetical protein